MDIPEFAKYLNDQLERAESKPRCLLDTFNCGDTAGIIDDMTKDMSANDLVGFVHDMSEALNSIAWRAFVSAIRVFPELAKRFDNANSHVGEAEHLLEEIILAPEEGLGLPYSLQKLHDTTSEQNTIREIRKSQVAIRAAVKGGAYNAVFDRESAKIHNELRKMENSEITRRDNAKRQLREGIAEEPKQLTKKQLGTLDEDIRSFLTKVPETIHPEQCTGACMPSPTTLRKITEIEKALRREINDLKPILNATDKKYDFAVKKEEALHPTQKTRIY